MYQTTVCQSDMLVRNAEGRLFNLRRPKADLPLPANSGRDPTGAIA
jgi:hypothetical protein